MSPWFDEQHEIGDKLNRKRVNKEKNKEKIEKAKEEIRRQVNRQLAAKAQITPEVQNTLVEKIVNKVLTYLLNKPKQESTKNVKVIIFAQKAHEPHQGEIGGYDSLLSNKVVRSGMENALANSIQDGKERGAWILEGQDGNILLDPWRGKRTSNEIRSAKDQMPTNGYLNGYKVLGDFHTHQNAIGLAEPYDHLNPDDIQNVGRNYRDGFISDTHRSYSVSDIVWVFGPGAWKEYKGTGLAIVGIVDIPEP
jgi:hypothetical protein